MRPGIVCVATLALLRCARASSAPLAQWLTADVGEVIAVDMNYTTYMQNKESYALGFQAALEDMLPNTAINVVDCEPSTTGTVLVYFNVLLPPLSNNNNAMMSSDYSVPGASSGVRALFCPGAALVDVDTPACAPLVAALATRMGVPVRAAYYNDQITASAGKDAHFPPSTVKNERVTLLIAFDTYARSEMFYGAAFAAAFDAALNVARKTVLVTDFQPLSDANSVEVRFDVVGSKNTVRSLFPACVASTGCPAGSTLTAALAAQGITALATYL